MLLIITVGAAFSFTVNAGDAAAVSKPKKVSSLTARATSYSTAYMSWSKAKKASGYQVVRNGREVCKTRSRSCADYNLAASSGYTYKVRAYKSYKKKQYFNKKNGKWQSKKPSKKYRGGKRYVTKYRYGSYSPSRTIWTPAAPSGGSTDSDTPKVTKPGEKDTQETVVTVPDAVDENSKEVIVAADPVANADDPLKIAPTYAKAVDPAAVSKVTDLTVKANSKNVQLSWTAIAGASGYQVYRSDSETGTAELLYTSSQAKYCDSAVTTGTTYYYKVRAFVTANSISTFGAYSDVKNVTIPKSSADNTHVWFTASGITISWDEPTSQTDAQKQQIVEEYLDNEYKDADYTWDITVEEKYMYRVCRDTSLLITKYLSTSYTDNKKLENGKTYEYEISPFIIFSAVGTATDSSAGEDVNITKDYAWSKLADIKYSNILYETDTAGFTNTSASAALLSPPAGLEANGNYDNVQLSWTANDMAGSYKVYRNGTLVGTVSKTSYKDTGLSPETSYTYSVKSVSAKGAVSTASSELTIKTPAKPSFLPPADFMATANYNQVQLSWTANGTVDSYKIYRNDVLIATAKSDETAYIDASVSPQTQYKYSVSSVRGTDESIKTSLNVKTPAEPLLLPPSNVKAVGTYDNINITWSLNASAESYNIYKGDVKIANVTTSGYNDSGLTPRTLYKYSVSSVIGEKESAKSSFEIYTSAKPDAVLDVDKNVTLSYGNADIYLGEKWSDSIKNALAAGSSGTDSVERPGYTLVTKIDSNHRVLSEVVLSETVYMFDTGDYSDFLTVYVDGDQILGWATNRVNLGSENGTAFTRGTTKRPAHAFEVMENGLADGSWYFKGINEGGVFIGGFMVQDVPLQTSLSINNKYVSDFEKEKVIGFHYINAYRVAMGLSPLIYSNDLDGKKNTWSGTAEDYDRVAGAWITKTFTNVRYGAQPFAETISASHVCTHSTETVNSGPLAGMSSSARSSIIEKRVNDRLIVSGENCGSGFTGETCIGVYEGSVFHLNAMAREDVKYIGIGFGEDSSYMLHAEIYGKDFSRNGR